MLCNGVDGFCLLREQFCLLHAEALWTRQSMPLPVKYAVNHHLPSSELERCVMQQILPFGTARKGFSIF